MKSNQTDFCKMFTRIHSLCYRIASIHPKHDEDELQINIEDNEDGTIRIDLYSAYERNTSCSCHPEYETIESETIHNLEWSLLTDDTYFTEYDECLGNHPYLATWQKEMQEAEEAKKRKLEEEKEAKRKAAEQAQRDRERREYERLKKQFETE